MPDIKLTIDGTEYEMVHHDEYDYPNHPTPVMYMEGEKYLGKAIRKEKDIPKPPVPIHWEIVAFKIYGDIMELMEWRKYRCYSQPTYQSPGRQGSLSWLLTKVKENEATIYSVKDLVKDEIYTVGDICTDGKIERFYFSCDYFLIDTDKCTCLSLPYLQKVKPKVPLFTTQDGVEIFEGDSYWNVSDDFRISYTFIVQKNWTSRMKRAFSTEEKATEFIIMNKPTEITMKDILVLWANDFVLFQKLVKIHFKEKHFL